MFQNRFATAAPVHAMVRRHLLTERYLYANALSVPESKSVCATTETAVEDVRQWCVRFLRRFFVVVADSRGISKQFQDVTALLKEERYSPENSHRSLTRLGGRGIDGVRRNARNFEADGLPERGLVVFETIVESEELGDRNC